MERRNFLHLSLVGVSGTILTPKLVLAGTKKQGVAGGVFYTKENPGRWSKKVAGHLPNIEIEQSANEASKIQVVTAHEMNAYKHYIVKHVLLDQNYNFLDEQLFDPMKDKTPTSIFTLDNYKGAFYVLSMCNKHDVWLNSAKI